MALSDTSHRRSEKKATDCGETTCDSASTMQDRDVDISAKITGSNRTMYAWLKS